MKIVDFDDIDYANMDDLPLSDHIEWNQLIEKKVVRENVNENWAPVLNGLIII